MLCQFWLILSENINMYVILHPPLSSSTASLSSSSSFPPPPPRPPSGPFPAPPPSTKKKFRIIKTGTIHLLGCGNVHGRKVFRLVESVTV